MNTYDKLNAFYKKLDDEMELINKRHKKDRAKLIKQDEHSKEKRCNCSGFDLSLENDWYSMYDAHLKDLQKFDKKHATKLRLAAVMETYVAVKDKFQSR